MPSAKSYSVSNFSTKLSIYISREKHSYRVFLRRFENAVSDIANDVLAVSSISEQVIGLFCNWLTTSICPEQSVPVKSFSVRAKSISATPFPAKNARVVWIESNGISSTISNHLSGSICLALDSVLQLNRRHAAASLQSPKCAAQISQALQQNMYFALNSVNFTFF